MTKLRLLAIFACAGLVAISAVACGDDDDPANPDSGVPDTGPTTDSGTDPDGGNPDGSNPDGGPSTFPRYVQTLIETKTSDNGSPDPEAVWGTLADDDKYVYPATFF